MNGKLYPLILAGLLLTPFLKAQITFLRAERTKPRAQYRWLVSANPLGLLEGVPSAASLGLGYRWNAKTEIWTEPSYLFSFTNPTVSGYRVILQTKRFLKANNFLALEGRIKSWHFNDSGTFYNPQENPARTVRWFHSNNVSYGAALQFGHRIYLSPHNAHCFLELTVGLGLKYKTVQITGPPPGNTFEDDKIDLNVWDFLEAKGFAPYFPGSLRIVYTLGKR